MNKNSQVAKGDGELSHSQKTATSTGNSGAEIMKDQQSTSAQKKKSSRSTPQNTSSTLPAKLVNDPAILLAQLNDILLAMQKAGWFVVLVESQQGDIMMLCPCVAPPPPHVVGLTGNIREPVITLNGEEI